MAEPKQTDVLKQINAAWDQAQEQLHELRAEVQRNAEMAQAALQAKFLSRDKDKALRDFGEAVWSHMKKGKLQLPPALTSAVKAMLEAEKKVEAHASQITDLLKEGAEAADRLRGKKNSRNSVVAVKGKKR